MLAQHENSGESCEDSFYGVSGEPWWMQPCLHFERLCLFSYGKGIDSLFCPKLLLSECYFIVTSMNVTVCLFIVYSTSGEMV